MGTYISEGLTAYEDRSSICTEAGANGLREVALLLAVRRVVVPPRELDLQIGGEGVLLVSAERIVINTRQDVSLAFVGERGASVDLAHSALVIAAHHALRICVGIGAVPEVERSSSVVVAIALRSGGEEGDLVLIARGRVVLRMNRPLLSVNGRHG